MITKPDIVTWIENWSEIRSEIRSETRSQVRSEIQFHTGRQQITHRKWRARKTHAHLHWLAVVTDTRLRTIQELRGEKIPILQQMYIQCCAKIHEEKCTSTDQIMTYIHHAPRVYKPELHVHFKHPIILNYSHDLFRIHPLPDIINNLQVDPEYSSYARSPLVLQVYPSTEL